VVVVDFGTATTVDLVGEGGDYLGGAIAPGLSVAADALVEHTAALRRVELTTPRSVVGRSTVEAIQSGLVFGYAGLVDGLVGRMLEAHPQAATVATGGVAALVVPHCKLVSTVDENLTLFGLSLVFQLNVA
jgi:type III pantothenate kinase